MCPSFEQFIRSQWKQKKLLDEIAKSRYSDQPEIKPEISEINKHPLWYITGLVPFRCSYCSKVLSSERNLEQHLRRYHTEERPFKCELCNKAYASNSSLYNHMRIHSGEKAFECSFCTRRFADSSSVKKHINSYHMKETLYQCKWCNKRFAAPYTFVEHVTIHTGKKPFSCRKCKLRFRTKNIREQHMVQCKINPSKVRLSIC